MNSNWKTIESAPKNGTDVLLWDGQNMQVAAWQDTGIYDQKGWGFGDILDDYNARSEVHQPTHWMPLPEPPQTFVTPEGYLS